MPNKSLGQHWLRDRPILMAVAECAEIEPTDTIVEIGPGLGTLTSVLLEKAGKVIAIEYDEKLARNLPGQFPGKNLEVIHNDILRINTDIFPHVYKVVANIPYYITAKIVHLFSTCTNMPIMMVLLVQKEVAERLSAEPGQLSILGLSAQVYWEVSRGPIVGREWFTPAPKVDSQVVIMRRREQPLVPDADQKAFFHVVKAGFSEKRKKLRSALSGGLALDKTVIDVLLDRSNISPLARAQELTIAEWQTITGNYRDLLNK